jgi:hypothetical protein
VTNTAARPRLASQPAPPATAPADETPADPAAAFQRTPAEAALFRVIGKLDTVLADLIVRQMPGQLAQALAVALSQAPQESLGLCAFCTDNRCDWDDANTEVVDFAQAQLRAAREATPEAPLALETFLPEHVRADPADPFPADGVRMPYVLQAVAMRSGWGLCPFHIEVAARATRKQRHEQAQRTAAQQAAAQPQPAPQRELLVPPRGMDASTAAKIASQGIPQQ